MFDGLTCIFQYSGLVEKIIKKIKFEFCFDTYQELIELGVTVLGEDKNFTKIYSPNLVLSPVPLHPVRLRWRGFNQSEILAKNLAEKLKLKFIPDLLIRTKNTQTQSLLKKDQRQKNIKNAFALNPKYQILNDKFIIFDDIWTTGSTMKECAKTLKKNGAGFIWGLALAS